MKHVNWGIIGLGAIATKLANAIKLSSNARLLGVSSKNKDRIEYFKENFDIQNNYCFNNYEDLLNSKDIDIVYIALPNSLHFEWISRCIEKKKKVLVEKPAVLNFKEIDYIKNKIGDIFFAEGFMYVYHPQILKVLSLIKEERIGRLISMESNFGIDIMNKKNFFGFKIKRKINEKNRLFNKELGGGAILDLGCYPVSFSSLIGLFNQDNEYSKINVKNIRKEIGNTGVDLNSSADLYFDNGFKSKIRASFNKNLGQRSFITGTEGVIILENTWTADKPIIEVKGKKNEKFHIESAKNVYIYEIEALSKCIIENKNKPDFPGLNLNDTLRNTKILDEWLK